MKNGLFCLSRKLLFENFTPPKPWYFHAELSIDQFHKSRSHQLKRLLAKRVQFISKQHHKTETWRSRGSFLSLKGKRILSWTNWFTIRSIKSIIQDKCSLSATDALWNCSIGSSWTGSGRNQGLLKGNSQLSQCDFDYALRGSAKGRAFWNAFLSFFFTYLGNSQFIDWLLRSKARKEGGGFKNPIISPLRKVKEGMPL